MQLAVRSFDFCNVVCLPHQDVDSVLKGVRDKATYKKASTVTGEYLLTGKAALVICEAMELDTEEVVEAFVSAYEEFDKEYYAVVSYFGGTARALAFAERLYRQYRGD